MQVENKKNRSKVISFFVVFIISLIIFRNWNTIETFIIQLFK